MSQVDRGLTITIISTGPGVGTVAQKICSEKPFMLPKPIPATPKR
jgi:hypothetical protein